MITKKKIIPKSVNRDHLITDPNIKNILKNSDQDIKIVIDSLTRKHLRLKHPTRVIEGQEKISGRFIDVWYDYQ